MIGGGHEIALRCTARAAARALRRMGRRTVLLEGHGEAAWTVGPLVALDPRLASGPPTLARLAEIVAARRRSSGDPATGVAAVLAYDRVPQGALLCFEVDAALSFREATDRPRLALRSVAADEAAVAGRIDDLERALERGSADVVPALRTTGAPRTSLPRERYLEAVERIREHIAAGDVYQANLCQQLRVPVAGDAFELYGRLAEAARAPHAAFVEADGWALASVSPETFVRATPDGSIATLPIKGTRRRGATPDADRAAAAELLGSSKDRAELLMIVDLERNDLGRVCEAGSIRVPLLAELRSFPAVHHLVARVEGRLRAGLGADALIRAVFPGGSISGAPKRRAIELLRELEPVPRGAFSGSLMWFGDDGTIDSSILIRSVELGRGEARVGAGGGIVADSDAEAEWRESCDKARALAHALGFEPEEAR